MRFGTRAALPKMKNKSFILFAAIAAVVGFIAWRKYGRSSPDGIYSTPPQDEILIYGPVKPV